MLLSQRCRAGLAAGLLMEVVPPLVAILQPISFGRVKEFFGSCKGRPQRANSYERVGRWRLGAFRCLKTETTRHIVASAPSQIAAVHCRL